MNITVKRHRADRPAPDIVEPLLTDIRAAIERGRAELDSGEELQVVRITSLYVAGIKPGDLVEVADMYQGGPYRGKVTSVAHAAADGKLLTELELARL
ncbi:MAG: hypothetical protein OEZ55_13655 [Nitrospinota bacterium]|nr:hypothetical protein [Nitrospinota bacterium]